MLINEVQINVTDSNGAFSCPLGMNMADLSEYKLIPTYSRYAVDRYGNGIVIQTNEPISWHKSNGYLFSKLTDDLGNKRSVGQHRAVALAFIELPDTSEYVTVNHKDGNRSNNFDGNLEWLSYGDNTLHAYRTGLRTDRVPVILTHLHTGEVLKFFSKGECARYIGWSRVQLSNGIKKQQRTFVKFPYKFEFLIEESTWWNFDEYPTGVAARNIQLGAITIASNPGELGKILKVCPKVIKRVLKSSKFQYPTFGYDFRVISSDLNWPEYTEEELKAYLGINFIYCPVRVFHQNGTNILFGSVLKASEFTGTNQRSIRFYLKENKMCPNGYIYEPYVRNIEMNL